MTSGDADSVTVFWRKGAAARRKPYASPKATRYLTREMQVEDVLYDEYAHVHAPYAPHAGKPPPKST